MKATELARELNKRGNLPNKIYSRDIKMLWGSGWITGNKPARECFGRTKFKAKDINFNNVSRAETEILSFLEKKKRRETK
jgi:hypothetical protein